MSQFEFLESKKNLFTAMTEVEKRIDAEDWDVAVQKMRTALQELVKSFYAMYHVIPQGNLEYQINALKTVGLISPDSADTYHKIRMMGNQTSHENVNVQRDDALDLYARLSGEMILFAEKYSVEEDELAGARLYDPFPEKRKGNRNNIIPAPLVRIIGLFQIVFAAYWLNSATQFSSKNEPLFILVGVVVILFGLYSLITGNDVLIRNNR